MHKPYATNFAQAFPHSLMLLVSQSMSMPDQVRAQCIPRRRHFAFPVHMIQLVPTAAANTVLIVLGIAPRANPRQTKDQKLRFLQERRSRFQIILKFLFETTTQCKKL